jgi:type IV pilus assembly protein PilC
MIFVPKFSYKARSKSGEIQIGVLEEISEKSVRKKLEEDGLLLISLKEGAKEKKNELEFLNNLLPISDLEVITFVHLLSVMVKAGMPLSKSLNALAKQTSSVKFGKIISDVGMNISKGNTFADALSKHPDVFDELFVNMIRVGELSGTLESILFLLAEQKKKDYELRSKVKGAMIYPAVILFVMFLVGIVVMVYVIPKLATIFSSMNVELPVTTRFLMAASAFLVNYGLYLVPVIILLGFLLKKLITGRGSAAVDKIILKLPVFGEIAKKINIARFARTTSSLIKGGVAISTALKTVSKTLSNHYYRKSILTASEKIEKGLSLKEILEGFEGLYPPLVLQMIEVGEETGSLDDILMELAEFYEGEINETTKNLSTVIEPMLMVVMGVAVGFFAISIIQPMYSIGDAIK